MFRLIFIVAFIQLSMVNVARTQTYRAGVVVYKPVNSQDASVDEDVTKNIEQYVDIIRQQQNKVDILVFPEYGITNIQVKLASKADIRLSSAKIGSINDVVCKTNKSEEISITLLGCAAKNYSIYFIANLIENAGESFYVTTVGFAPDGTLCLKCRKHHLGNGTSLDRAADQKSCSFTANFQNKVSVPFTVLFGDDLLYEMPTDIKNKNVIVTSSIKNALPLNVGFSLYQGFAISNNVNLLVSGYYDNTPNNYGGSGIYYSNGTNLIAFKPDAAATSKILIKEVPVIPTSPSTVQVQANVDGEIPKLNLQYMNIPAVNETKKVFDRCFDKNCCSFKADLAADNISPYKWVALSNKTVIADQEVEIFLCALIAPSTNAPTITLKSISITSNIDKTNLSETLPIALGQNLLPVNYIFNKETNDISLNHEETVVVFGILQMFNSGVQEPGANVALIVVISILCVVLVGLLVGFLIWRNRQNKNRRSL